MKIAVWILAALVVVGLGAAVYFGFIRPNTKPTPTTTQTSQQEAQNITNYEYTYTYSPRVSFGCASWRIGERDVRVKRHSNTTAVGN